MATFFYFLAWFFYVPMETAQEVKDKNENIGSKGLLTDEEGVKSEETL